MTLDRQRLHEALTLAESVIGLTEPNPRVGCIIGHVDGRVLGRGATQEAGGPHAEVMALRDAAAAGHEVRGATAWVTLEPCAHHGRTPPCCDALVAAGMARVVVGARDPFPGVDGAGMARLRAAGIEVDLADPDIAAACRELNIGFFSRFERGRPWVRLKLAASLDAVTALADGRSQWITGPEARADGHAFRRRAGAVLSGIGTVLHDNPRLDVRLVPTPRQPLRVVLDSQWRTPPTARLFEAEGPLLLVGTPPADAAAQARATTLDALAATLEAPRRLQRLELPGDAGRVDLAALLPALAARSINELHLEAGAALNGAWLAAGLVDELLLYLAPTLLGEGLPLARLAAPAGLGDKLPPARRWQWHEVAPVGADLRLRLRRAA
jgi:diaminohydroxyphosphoribosylaminopyrimidine deaminase / 5-amino-6-(5-phosphoribosylamino)uracil reductase